MGYEKNKKLLQKYLFTTLCDQELDIIDELLIDKTIVNTEFGKSIGTQGVKQNYKEWFEIFPDVQCEILDTVLCKDTVIFKFVQQATHLGSLCGIAATGKKVFIDTCAIYRLNQGKIVDYFVASNLSGVLKQLDVNLSNNNKFFLPLTCAKEVLLKELYSLDDVANNKKIKLTLREIECLSLWLNGRSAKQIAQLLSFSFKTAQSYLAKVALKFDCRTRAEIFDKVNALGVAHLFDDFYKILKSEK